MKAGDDEAHAAPPSDPTALVSAGVLLAALVAIVGLAKALTPIVEIGVASLGATEAVVGIVIAALVLLPEGLAALRAAQSQSVADQPQSRLGVRAGEHRTHDSSGRCCFNRASKAP